MGMVSLSEFARSRYPRPDCMLVPRVVSMLAKFATFAATILVLVITWTVNGWSSTSFRDNICKCIFSFIGHCVVFSF